MTQIVIEELDPMLVEKLKVRAQRQGRSLEAELKAILEAAAEAEVVDKETAMAAAWERIDKARTRYAGRTFSDSTELIREDRDH